MDFRLRAVSHSGAVNAFECPVHEKDGHLWKCVDVQPNPKGGKLFTFEFRKEYLDAHMLKDKLRDIFPAVEPSDVDVKELIQINTLRGGDLKLLGYEVLESENSIRIVLPSRRALLSNWADFRTFMVEADDHDPEAIDIESSAGVASDMGYAEAFMLHDGILSNGQEFVHDHFAHIFPMLAHRLNVGACTARATKAEQVAKASLAYGAIMNSEQGVNSQLELLQMSLGAYVDIMANMPHRGETYPDFDSKEIRSIWSHPAWMNYAQTRFTNFDEASIDGIIRTWELLQGSASAHTEHD